MDPALYVSTSGYVGIGTTTPEANLDVSGTIRHTGILIDASDRRLKSNIRQLPTSLEAMMKLNPVSFTMNDNPAQTEYGFIAQDVQPLFPTLVVTGNDPSKTLSLNYPGFIAPMVKAMQELKADNDNVRRELNDLRKELRDLKSGDGKRIEAR